MCIDLLSKNLLQAFKQKNDMNGNTFATECYISITNSKQR